MEPKIIGLTGLAGSGKSTVAGMLATKGFLRLRFADTLKNMLRCLGLNEDEIEGKLKEIPCALLGGCTPRRAMQTLGTEWGRDTISSNLWVDATMADMDRRTSIQEFPVVFEDVRFPNEALAILRRGGVIWRIERPEPASTTGQSHVSEQGLGQIQPHRILKNNGSLAKLGFMVGIKLDSAGCENIE